VVGGGQGSGTPRGTDRIMVKPSKGGSDNDKEGGGKQNKRPAKLGLGGE